MQILIADNWTDYELLDSGDGKRLERFGKYRIVRPDPQVIWKKKLPQSEWESADAEFIKISEDKGRWKTKTQIPERWEVGYGELKFFAKLTPFKHTGIFPEQSVQWDFISEKIKGSGESLNILNLFGYTGIASSVAAAAGAKVTHVDASKSSIGWARDNQDLSGLSEKPIRWILDDAIKFCEREVRRGVSGASLRVKYDGIIMDPPIYGHGPEGELWKFSESFPKLLEICKNLLSDNPKFIIINAYAISSSALMLENMLLPIKEQFGGEITVGELALKESSSPRLLSTGIFGRWEK